MTSTRDRILHTLLTNPTSSITELAKAGDINTICVRHHLTDLQAEGLIQASEERHGVGRPRLIYSLTDTGLEKFPTRYMTLTNRLLEQLKSTLTQKEINELFVRMAKSLAADHLDRIKNLPIEQKLDAIRKTLGDEGFMIEWQKIGEDYHIIEKACPFYHVGQSHPEVCIMDQTLISTMLSIPTQKIECVLNGDVHCTYLISAKSIAEA